MHLDVVDLKTFYYRTRLGRSAQKALRARVQDFWPDAAAKTMVGFGFAAPLLRPYLADATRVISVMPAQQGVMHWPPNSSNMSVLAEEVRWPIPTGTADRILVMHGLETSKNPGALLDEIWRVLSPSGRVLTIVPNRSGMWSRRDVTPFGYGRPYSLGQLEAQLVKHRFSPEQHKATLYTPPSPKRFWLKVAPFLESFGQKVSSHVAGGVLMVEAGKQVYAPHQKGLPAAVKRPLEVLEGIGRPKPGTVSGRS